MLLVGRRISRRIALRNLAGVAFIAGSIIPFVSSCGAGPTVTSSPKSTPKSTPSPTPTSSSLGTLLYTYHGHFADVSTVAWAPDGTHIASSGSDRTVQICDAASGGLTFTYHGHSSGIYVTAVAWSPDGKRI